MKFMVTIEMFVSRKIVVSVAEHSTVRDVRVVVVNYRVVIPVWPPVVPPPSITTDVPKSKACAKCYSGSVKVESRV